MGSNGHLYFGGLSTRLMKMNHESCSGQLYSFMQRNESKYRSQRWDLYQEDRLSHQSDHIIFLRMLCLNPRSLGLPLDGHIKENA